MAEVTALRNNALPYPIYGVPFGVAFPLLDSTGAPISPSSPDSEVSKNGDTFADCTNEAVEIATSSGICYLLLTAAEMTADVVTVQIKSTGAKTTVLTLYPRKLVSLRSGTSQTGAAGTITLDAGASAIDDYYNGCIIVATIDTLIEARVITDYVGSTKIASVTPNWNVTPDSDDTFIIYLPEGRQIVQAVNDAAASLGTAAQIVTALLTTQMTEAYHADGVAPTLAQALFFLISSLTEFSISGVTITAKKLDGSTSAATFTLDSSTAPTSRTRAT